MNDLIGQRVEHYRIDALLGRGGMGAVYRAYDLNLARPVALKVMHQHLADETRFQQRFMQEAQAIARLDHPSIVNIYNFGSEQDLLYMVMAFVAGGNLGDYLKQLDKQEMVARLDEVLFILAQVADALGYAHSKGVVHRDVKPDNVMLKQLARPDRAGEPAIRAIVTDFGLAKLLAGGGMHTATGMFMGTLAYMSPEQCMGEELDGRSDIYALGIMLYRLVTGALPFEINSPTDAIMKHVRQQPRPPHDIKPGVPDAVEAIIYRAIAKDPAERYQKADDMAAALRQAAGHLSEADTTTFADKTAMYSLMTQVATSAAATEIALAAAPPSSPVGTQPARRVQGGVRAVIEPTKLSLKPGTQGVMQIHLANDSSAVDYVKVSVPDLPTGWLTVSQEPVTVSPGAQATLPLIIRPPAEPQTAARDHPFRVSVFSVTFQREIATLACQLTVSPFEQYEADLRPARMRSGQTSQLLLRNDSNVPLTFHVAGSDPDNVIRFEASGSSLDQVAPGQLAGLDLRVFSTRRPLLGRSQSQPFNIEVSTSNGRKELGGLLDVGPRIPIWLLVLLLILVLMIGGGGGALALLGPGILDGNSNDSTATAEVAVVAGETAQAGSEETAVAQQTAEAEGTALALVAQAEGDDDNDGLSNQTEEEIGTDPNRSDTDGDGLLDGEEINQHGSDPMVADTDGDGLTDGQETRIYQTSPTAADTDSDGIDDGTEVEQRSDPLTQPTETPEPTATLTPTPEATETPTPTVTPSPTPTPTRRAGVGAGPGLPLGFEDFGSWARGDQPNGTFEQSSEQVHSGGAAAKLSYDFSSPDNDYVVFLQFNDISGQPSALHLWVYGDSSGHYLNGWIIDADGQTWQVPFGVITHTGWKEMTGQIDTEQDWPWTHISGNDNGQVDYPIRFRGFVLDDVNNAYTGQGEIYLDDLIAVE